MNNQPSNKNIFLKNSPAILKIISQKNANIKFDDFTDISNNAAIALENKLIQKALIKNQTTLKEVLNISDMGLKALDYPTIKRCLSNKLNLFFSKIDLHEVLEIKTKEELNSLLKKYRQNLKKNPLFLFLVPAETHDQLHELRQNIIFEKKELKEFS